MRREVLDEFRDLRVGEAHVAVPALVLVHREAERRARAVGQYGRERGEIGGRVDSSCHDVHYARRTVRRRPNGAPPTIDVMTRTLPTEHVTITPSILYFGTPVVLISTENLDGTPNLAPMSSAVPNAAQR